jgi:uncharacterized damage-inducible protein DinB
MPQADIIADVRAAREDLRDAIAGLSPDEMVQPGAVGLWSVKDVLAHLVSWEAELVTALSRLEQHKTRPPRIVEIEDIDEWNDEQYHTNARRTLDDVLQDFEGVHRQVIRAINEVSNRDLDDNRRFPWMEGEPLSYLILENAVWHEEEHAEDIRAWRDARRE